jgi:heat shock protein HslJ
MKMLYIHHLYFLTAVFLFLACNKDSRDESNPDLSTLAAKLWTLKYIQGHGSNSITYYPDIPENITIEFNNKLLIFKGICNTGSGSFVIENDKLIISDLGTTKVYCSNIEWEVITQNSLRNAYKIELSGSKLFIYSTEFNLVFD